MQEQVQQVTLDEVNASIADLDALGRLEANADFKRLFIEGYFKDEAVRLVMAKADPSLQEPEAQAAILRDIDGIGSLRGYLGGLRLKARMAEKAKADYLASKAAE